MKHVHATGGGQKLYHVQCNFITVSCGHDTETADGRSKSDDSDQIIDGFDGICINYLEKVRKVDKQ